MVLYGIFSYLAKKSTTCSQIYHILWVRTNIFFLQPRILQSSDRGFHMFFHMWMVPKPGFNEEILWKSKGTQCHHPKELAGLIMRFLTIP